MAAGGSAPAADGDTATSRPPHHALQPAAAGAGGSEALPSSGPSSVSGQAWDEQVEGLQAANAALEATVSGLRMSLAAATRQLHASSAGGGDEEDEAATLRLALADALAAKAELAAAVAVLEADLQKAPLAGAAAAIPSSDGYHEEAEAAHASGGAAADAGEELHLQQQLGAMAAELLGLHGELGALRSEVEQLTLDRSVLTATVAGLRLEVTRLQEDKADAEGTVERLSAEMQELAEAMDAAGEENERLSLELLELRGRAEAWDEAEAAVVAGASPRGALAAAQRRQLGGDGDEETEQRLARVRAATQELLAVLAAGGSGRGGAAIDDDDLEGALHAAKVRVYVCVCGGGRMLAVCGRQLCPLGRALSPFHGCTSLPPRPRPLRLQRASAWLPSAPHPPPRPVVTTHPTPGAKQCHFLVCLV